MDSKEISIFKKTIDDLVKSENGDCMYQDVMLSFVKNKTDFPNMKILNELLPTQFPVIIAHKPFNKTPVQTVSDQNTFVTDNKSPLFLKVHAQVPVGVANHRKSLYIGAKPDIFLLITQ
jgi:hypothetical protein